MVMLPITPDLQFSTFYIAFHIFVVGKCIETSILVDSLIPAYQRQTALKGAWSGHMTNFKFLVLLKYLWNG